MPGYQSGDPAPARGGAFDYAGPIAFEYSPHLDKDADPGEVVWTWVAYEDDPHIGKDRPVAVIGRTGDQRLVALMLSSKDHDAARNWTPIGAGPWDVEGRPSWVRRDRVLAVAPAAVRREGAILPRPTYDSIVQQLRPGASASTVRTQRPGIGHRLIRLFRR